MPPKNNILTKDDILKGAYISWSTKNDDAIGKIKSSKLSDDGFTFVAELDLNSIITFPKEKMMNKNEKLKDVNCICVFKDGDEVKAVAMRNVHNVFLEGSNLFTDNDGSGSKVVARASAKCNPNDIFDFNIGAKLALDRLYEGYDMTPKPKRKPFNGLIRIIWDEDSFDSLEVINGKLKSQVFVLRCPCQQKDTIYEDSSFEEMKQALLNCASFTWNNGKPPKAICRDHIVTYHL